MLVSSSSRRFVKKGLLARRGYPPAHAARPRQLIHRHGHRSRRSLGFAKALCCRGLSTPSQDILEQYTSQLEAKGQTVPAHVMQSQRTARFDSDKCPFLQTDPVLQRAAARESNARTYARRFPISIKKASGVWLEDAQGNKFLDALACAGTLSLGHNHPVVKEAILEFVASGQPLQSMDMASTVKDKYVSTVFEALPEQLASVGRVQFCGPSGADALDAAVKLAKLATGRETILAFHGAYHGHTHGTLAMMGNLSSKGSLMTLMPGVHFLPFPYDYRCPFGLGGDAGWKMSARYIEHVLNDVESGIQKPAAIVLEPIQGEGGVIPAPAGWLKEIRRITQEHDILLIVDEVQTGWGRSGDMFAHAESGIKPDILALSKAVGGSLPMAMIVYDSKIDLWEPGQHAGTFRGNQLAMATGTAAIRYSLDNDIPGQAAKKGAWLRQALEDLQKKHPSMGNIRGRGMMLGVEMVDPNGTPDSQGSLPPNAALASRIQFECFRRNLIIEKGGRYGCVVRFLAPLIINEEELSLLVSRFGEAVAAAEEYLQRSK